MKNNELTSDKLLANEHSFYEFLCRRYDIPEDKKNDSVYRKLVGLRYDMETNDFEFLHKYVLVKDIDEKTKTELAESLHLMHGNDCVPAPLFLQKSA